MLTPGFEYEGFDEARAIARRRRIRVGLPIAVVVVMLLALIGIAVYDYKTMRADALALSQGVIVNLESRIETQIEAYLKPIPGIIRLSRDLLAGDLASGIPGAKAETLGIGMLNNAPQLTALFVGDDSGEFLMVRRYAEDGRNALETKLIRHAPGRADQLEIELTRRNPDGAVISTEALAWDQYDPRQRPWYKGATEQRGLYWTNIYPFFTDRAAGITAALPLLDDDGKVRAVVGADVTLDSISRFLDTLTVGKTGLALIIDDQGQLIAHPKAELIREGADGKLRLTQIGDLSDPVVHRAFDRYRVQGHGRRDFDLDGRRYISSVTSLNHLLQRDWSVLLVVPEDDFVGFVVDNVSKTLGMGLSVIALAALLASLLIRQGLRADRDALRILERQAQLDAQGKAFGQLAAVQSSLFDTHNPQASAALTEAVRHATQVRRISLWVLNATADALVCIDCFDRDTGGHTQGTRLSKANHADLFAALNACESLDPVDASGDPRLTPLHHQYLAPLGCRALLAMPICVAGRASGALWLEDDGTRREWPGHVVSFARAVANLLAIRQASFGASAKPSPDIDLDADSPRPAPPTRPRVAKLSTPYGDDFDTSLGRRRAAAFNARLATRADGEGGPRAEMLDSLAVMSLRLTDAAALAEPADSDAKETTVAFLLRELQLAAGRHEIGYLKFLSDQMIASIDPNEDPDRGLQQIVEFAMDAKTICETVLSRHHAPYAFRIGIDLGPAIGSLVGHEHRSFAFWGEAVRMAGSMADTALPGTIQVTESVYQRLKAHYLFQLRGHHYLAGLGELSTYLLGSRL